MNFNKHLPLLECHWIVDAIHLFIHITTSWLHWISREKNYFYKMKNKQFFFAKKNNCSISNERISMRNYIYLLSINWAKDHIFLHIHLLFAYINSKWNDYFSVSLHALFLQNIMLVISIKVSTTKEFMRGKEWKQFDSHSHIILMHIEYKTKVSKG